MKAIIFDFDGTILDTEHTEIAAWQFVYTDYGLTFPLDEWITGIGTEADAFDPVTHLQSILGDKFSSKIINNLYRKKLAELHVDLKPLPGVESWLQAAGENGLRLAIASNSSRNWIIKLLDKMQLLHHFEFILTRDDVKFLKPHPEIYHTVLKKLGILPHDALVIEDSPSGVTAALAAGLQCITVPTPLTKHLPYPTTFCRIDDLTQMSLAMAIQKLK